MKPVNLTVHKNTLAKRKEKEFRRNAMRDFKESLNKQGIHSYAYVTWSDGGVINTGYNCGKNLPTEVMPEAAKVALTQRLFSPH